MAAAGALLLAAAPQTPQRIVTFSEDVAPILYEHCVTCHRPHGWSSFSLVTFADVRPRARQIADAVARRVMPPWKPEAGHGGPFVGERRLVDREIATIQQWADEGSAAGPIDRLPAVPSFVDTGWQLGTPDLIVGMPEPYTLPAGTRDIVRNFVIRVPLSTTRYVKGLEVQPSNRRVAHHANIRLDRTGASARLDERDPEPGYIGITPSSATFPDGYFLGWTPGQVRPLLPAGMAWTIEPGSSLLVQLHLVPTSQPEPIQLRIGFYFTDTPPTVSPVMLRLGRQNIDIPAGDSRYIVTDTYTLPVDVEVQAIQPHAHLLAREIKGDALLPDGTARSLLYIKDWDFHWQDAYQYREPVALPRGTTLRMEYTYDNSANNRHNPATPPVRVRYGQQTSEEMGDLWLQLLPRQRTDLALLRRDISRKEIAEDLIGDEAMLAVAPWDAARHANLANAYIKAGRLDAAIAHLREAVRLEPDAAVAHDNLAATLASAGHREEAAASFRHALRLDANNAFAHNGLGLTLLGSGDVRAAVDEFAAAAHLEPMDPQVHNNLGIALQKLGRLDEAIEQYARAATIAPSGVVPQFNLANALAARGRIAEAAAAYERVLALDADHERTMVQLAWILATAPDASVRNPAKALTLALGAAERTGGTDASTLDVLAAAHAAAGHFDLAVANEQRALAIVSTSPTSGAAADDMRHRLDLYRRRQPYRAPVVPAQPHN
jgi:tetratricopeptide (TPR) repeat protein